MKNIIIIGAGQLGSRHLQALKSVEVPLNIFVVDPNEASLQISKERYDSIKTPNEHKISYLTNFSEIPDNVEIVINATNSDTRKDTIELLLNKSNIKYLILEKILFNKKEDYFYVNDLLNKSNVKCWVNFSMRAMDFYYNLKKEITTKQIVYQVTGSQFGLVTNVIHYLDHLVFLSDCPDFKINTTLIDKNIIESKRAGFKELNGIISANFKNGSTLTVCCYPHGNLPVVVEITSPEIRTIYRETEGKVFVSKQKNDWIWEEINSPIQYQSQRTTTMVKDLLNNGECVLTPYSEAIPTHIQLLDSLVDFINTISSQKYNYYPFT